MKSPVKFGANFALIGGKRVPYSLLGAVAAILGAVLIWAQFRNSGGIAVGGQSPDLSALTDALGGSSGGGGLDTSAANGSAVDLGGGTIPSQQYSYYVPSISQPTPIYAGSTSGELTASVPEPTAIGDTLPILTGTSGGGSGGRSTRSTDTGPSSERIGVVTKVPGIPLPANLIPGKTSGVTKF